MRANLDTAILAISEDEHGVASPYPEVQFVSSVSEALLRLEGSFLVLKPRKAFLDKGSI